jgi:oxygen-independent coproporphyrinogen-3 oxidase
VDVNLIFGIPGQTPDAAEADARAVLELEVDQISAYPLFAFPYTPLGHAIADGRVRPVDDGTRLEAQRRVSAACRGAGLERTSVWSFTRPGVAPYSTVTRDDYVGFGVGAGTNVRGELRFNTFSLDAYITSAPRPALELLPSERFRRVHWIYWQIYRTEVDPARYRALFGRDLERDTAPLLPLLRLLDLARHDGGVWRLTERGAIWVHRAQALFSLAFIDELWEKARDAAWPAAVQLR